MVHQTVATHHTHKHNSGNKGPPLAAHGRFDCVTTDNLGRIERLPFSTAEHLQHSHSA